MESRGVKFTAFSSIKLITLPLAKANYDYDPKANLTFEANIFAIYRVMFKARKKWAMHFHQLRAGAPIRTVQIWRRIKSLSRRGNVQRAHYSGNLGMYVTIRAYCCSTPGRDANQ